VSRSAWAVLAGLVTLVMVALSGCSAPEQQQGPVVVSGEVDDGWAGTRLEDPYQVPDVSLTDTSEQSYNLRTSPSTPVTLVFFGYTNCPDVCITVMSDLAMTLKRSDPGIRDKVTVLFITTDPARDDPEAIRDWLDRFDPSFVGLTGELARIKSIATDFGVPIEGMKKLPSGGYEVGHGTQVIAVTDHQGVMIWTPSTPIGDLKADLARLVSEQ